MTATANPLTAVIDPVKFVDKFWPDVVLYKQQKEISYSVWYNDETIVPAGHMLGKDFIAGLLTLTFFLTRTPCRVVNTSVNSHQLENVLWGEIRRFIQTAEYPLLDKKGGPLVYNHMHIRKYIDPPDNTELEGLSYIRGVVSEKGEGLSGHHIAQTGDGIPRTFGLFDEASGIDAETFERMTEWANRILIIGNPYECANYFKYSVMGRPGTEDKGGDILRDPTESTELVPGEDYAYCDVRAGGSGYHRKIIKITAEDSPNVRYGRAEEKAGHKPSNKIIVPGVLPYKEYKLRRIKWDEIKQTVGLDANFYEGAETLMFPPDWISNSERVADFIDITSRRKGLAMGVDPAEGGDDSAWAIIDNDGLIHLHAEKTPNTNKIIEITIDFMHRFGIPPENVCFDRGGGGKQHVDALRSMGYKVKSIQFGEAATRPKRPSKLAFRHRMEEQENRTTYKNRRAEMYGRLRRILDPSKGGKTEEEQVILDPTKPTADQVFALPSKYNEIRQQLIPIPLEYDGEGVLVLPPKNKRTRTDTRITLSELIGHSPDEADALVVAVHVLKGKQFRNQPRSMI